MQKKVIETINDVADKFNKEHIGLRPEYFKDIKNEDLIGPTLYDINKNEEAPLLEFYDPSKNETELSIPINFSLTEKSEEEYARFKEIVNRCYDRDPFVGLIEFDI